MTVDNREQDVWDEWQSRYVNCVTDFACGLTKLDFSNPWPEQPILPLAMNFLMTELWDKGFSQTEIRHAFEDALADMNRYAEGAERRS